jgi:hypothetical protein
MVRPPSSGSGLTVRLASVTAVAGLICGGVVWIGADSAGVSGDSLQVRADTKAFRSGSYVFGFTSSFRMGQLIRYTLDVPVPDPEADLHGFMCTTFTDALRECLKAGGWAEKDKDRETGGNFLAGVNGRLFEVFPGYQIGEREDPFTATGCGEDFVPGSLHTTATLDWPPEKRLVAALEAAERFSAGVQGPFRLVSTEAALGAPSPPSGPASPDMLPGQHGSTGTVTGLSVRLGGGERGAAFPGRLRNLA